VNGNVAYRAVPVARAAQVVEGRGLRAQGVRVDRAMALEAQGGDVGADQGVGIGRAMGLMACRTPLDDRAVVREHARSALLSVAADAHRLAAAVDLDCVLTGAAVWVVA
jgi:hypothetical protein